MTKFTKITFPGIGLLSQEHFDIGVAFFRVAIGVMMFVHGLDKFVHYHEKAPEFFDPFGIGGELSLALAIFAEGLCSLFVMAGFLLRLSLIPLVITMLVAFFLAHANDPYRVREIALLYLAGYLSLLAMGPGKLSLDHFLFQKFRRLNEG